ncbi:MAG: FecR domain-containing protein [Gemmatimonadaceae bacterium]
MRSEFNSARMPEPYDWDALARYVSGECSPEESRAIQSWLGQRPERARLIAALQQSLEGVAADESGIDVDAALERVHARMAEPAASRPIVAPAQPRLHLTSERVPRPGANRWHVAAPLVASLAAAAAIVMAVIGIRGSHRAAPEEDQGTVAAATYTTPVGGRDSVRLTDGTKVVLGPSSRLDVAAGYGGATRTVELHGEGYFDVVHDASRPFTVRAGTATIVDVGTSFTVRDDVAGRVRVAVTAGSVRVSRATAGDSGVVLAAGDIATLGDSTVPLVAHGALSGDDTAFTRGRLVFRDAPLAEVVVELRRWYGVELRVGDGAQMRRRLTATFEGESREQVMSVIGAALGARVERRGDTVFVR